MAGKCVLTSDPSCQLCETMQAKLNPQYGPGLWAYIPVQFSTGNFRMGGIVYTQTKSRKERPFLLAYCPFCGERLVNDEGKPAHDPVSE